MGGSDYPCVRFDLRILALALNLSELQITPLPIGANLSQLQNSRGLSARLDRSAAPRIVASAHAGCPCTGFRSVLAKR